MRVSYAKINIDQFGMDSDGPRRGKYDFTNPELFY